MSANFESVDHSPLMEDDLRFNPPFAPSLPDSQLTSARNSFARSNTPGTPQLRAQLISNQDLNDDIPYNLNEKAVEPRAKSSRRRILILGGLITLIVVILAVFLPVYFKVIKPQNHNVSNAQASSGSSTQPGSGSGQAAPAGPTYGFDGSQVTAADGTTFTYKNPFGGYWVEDPEDPYNNGARPQAGVPALNETWTFGEDLIHGVNLGGWFVLEPFLVPALFEKYQTGSIIAVDEWTLSQAMRADTSPGGGINQLEKHYQTFITEQDFAEIVGAGLNWIRLPIPFWAIDTWNDEPFLAQVCWKYILQAFAWARKYGLRIYLDLHTIPGSQNGFNHSGKDGQVDFMVGTMGLANAQRTLGYIRTITEFISQPEYADLIPIFGIVNEALLARIGRDPLTSFYLQSYNMMRNITGIGEGHGPYIAIHDGFQSLSSWSGFLPGSDRFILDTHPYLVFGDGPNTNPLSDFAPMPCNDWAQNINASQKAFGVTVAGEFTSATNDCGLWVRGVGGQPTYGGNCNDWTDASQWDSSIIEGLRTFTMTSMDSLQNYFFWTWKVGNSSVSNRVEAPLWSYKLGLQFGYVPSDPRKAYGACDSVGVQLNNPFDGTYSAWQTGGAGAGTIAPSVTSEFPWPPTTMADADNVSLLPTYTNTAPIETLPMQTLTFTSKGAVHTVSAGDGWFNNQDTTLGVTAVAGCSYPDPWDATGAPLPTALCPGPARREIAEPQITPFP